MNKFQIYVNPHCHDCQSVIADMQNVVKKQGCPAAEVINVLEALNTAVSMRITRMPALVFAGHVIGQGAVTETQLQEWLDKRMNEGDRHG